MNCDPKELAAASKCFCFNAKEWRAATICLLCSWANTPSFPCGEPSLIIQITGAGTAAANQYYTWDAGIPGWVGVESADTSYGITLSAGVWTLFSVGPAPFHTITNLYTSTAAEFPCTWTTLGGDDPAPTGLYASALPDVSVNTALPAITGTAQVGQTLSGSNGTWTNSPIWYTYRWLADGIAIGGATANTFLVTGAQVGAVITFEVTAHNAGGSSLPATSAGTAPVPSPGTVKANDWASRVVANGGAAPSAGTKTALANFWDSLIASSLVTTILTLNAFVPDNLTAARTPFIVGPSADPWINHFFVPADLGVTGLLGDGTTKYLDLGFQPSSLGNLNHGFTVYNTTGSNANQQELAVWNATTGFTCGVCFGGTCYYDDTYKAGAGRIAVVQGSTWTGYTSMNRVAANDQRIFQARSTVPHTQLGATNAAVMTDERAAIGFNFFLFCQPNSGVPAFFSSKTISFCAIHSGLSAAQSSTFFNAIVALRVALGGGWV